MRALAHPTRLALLDHLHTVDQATATECGAAVGDSPSSCSYHLRALARWKFVEEGEGGVGRERPWRATQTSSASLELTPSELEELGERFEELLDEFRGRDRRGTRRIVVSFGAAVEP